MQKTTLFEKHQELGASFTDFGGWNMPVRYGSDLEEHHAVRNSAGLFDISHMAEITVSGDPEFLDYALATKVSALENGRAKYTMILSPEGGIIDDLIVYRLGDQEYLVIANAGNREVVAHELKERAKVFQVAVDDVSDDFSLIALQGPQAEHVLSSRVSEGGSLVAMRYYSIASFTLSGVDVQIARTGYTGEDGFEILVSNESAAKIWDILLESELVTPCGLAARDTLRLEAGMPLYGHELGLGVNPIEAGLGRVLSELEFVGSHALAEPVVKQQLVGLVGEGRRAARADYELFHLGGTEAIGKITSGVLSPTLGYPIAMAYLDANSGLEIGSKLEADVRGTRVPYEIVKLPFYKRGR